MQRGYHGAGPRAGRNREGNDRQVWHKEAVQQRGQKTRWSRLTGLACAASVWAACAGGRITPAQEALRQAGDCPGLLLASDAARASGDSGVAALLGRSCPQAGLEALATRPPVEALLWCGRAAAAVGRDGQPGCDFKTVAALKEALRPRLTLGPSDPDAAPDSLLVQTLRKEGPELNLEFNTDPDVIVGELRVQIEHQTSSSFVQLADSSGRKRQVPALNHRFVARAQAQVELQERTRLVRASEEVRDTTWEAQPRWGIAAKAEPVVPPEEEQKQRAAAAWLRAVARSLWLAPPETVDIDDARGCVAYGLALNAQSGDPGAAANRKGDEGRLDACEKLLKVPHGAGIPVP